jgi:hypothetical protein
MSFLARKSDGAGGGASSLMAADAFCCSTALCAELTPRIDAIVETYVNSWPSTVTFQR